MARISEETAAAIVTRVKRKMLPVCGVWLQVYWPNGSRACEVTAAWTFFPPTNFTLANDHPEPFQ